MLQNKIQQGIVFLLLQYDFTKAMEQVDKVSDNDINEALHRKVYRWSKKEILLKERKRAINII